MRVVGYTSGAEPCGIADYHRKVAGGLSALGVACDTVPLPTDTIYRDRPLALWRRRRYYANLATRSRGYDATLLDLVTQWNGHRIGENTLPAFINHLRGPLFMIVHEWPPQVAAENGPRSSAMQALTQLTEVASRFGERRGLTYEDWLAKGLFRRANHILVHAPALQERLLAAGVSPQHITLEVFPIPRIRERAESRIVDEFARRSLGRRKIIVFGFPHPRKTLEHAVEALPQLPDDVMLMFVGGTEGAFRQQYVRSLRELGQRLGVADRLEFLGEVPEAALPSAFQLADLAAAPFAYATGSASFSYLISEGVPIVASDLPEHDRLVRDGAGIVTFSTGDVPGLARAVNDLLQDQQKRQTLAEKNRAFAERHTYTKLAATIRDRLEQMM